MPFKFKLAANFITGYSHGSTESTVDRDLVHVQGKKNPDTIDIQTSVVAFLQFDRRCCKQNLIPCGS